MFFIATSLIFLAAFQLSYPPEGQRLILPQQQGQAALGLGIDIADLDGDGFRDLVIGALGYSRLDGIAGRSIGSVILYRSPAMVRGGQLFENPQIAFNHYGGAVASGDMDGDGVADIAVGWDAGGEIRRGPRFNERIGPYPGGSAGESNIRFDDVDLDCFDDLLVAQFVSGANGRVDVYFGPDMSRTQELRPPQGDGLFFGPSVIATGDVNGDSWPDIVAG